jgi:hypothetical protein
LSRQVSSSRCRCNIRPGLILCDLGYSWDHFLRISEATCVLLHPDQTAAIITRTVRWIFVLSTRQLSVKASVHQPCLTDSFPEAPFFRSILGCPFPAEVRATAEGRIPIIERLASYTVYSHPQVSAKTAFLLHLGVLRVLTMLAVKNDDAVALMSDSVGLLSRLIARIAADSGRLYESDGEGFGGPSLSVTMLVLATHSVPADKSGD